MTVTGPIKPEDLGITIMHQHLFIDQTSQFEEPTGLRERELAYGRIYPEILQWVKENPHKIKDNLWLNEFDTAVKEIILAKMAGVKTIVDVTNRGIGRDHKALQEISFLVGINIIMGSGYYTGPSQPPENKTKSVEEYFEEIVEDVQVGVENTGIRSGIIGEIAIESYGDKQILDERERKSLIAAARAQAFTGVPLTIHPIFDDIEEGTEFIVDLVESEGADLNKVIICHQDYVLHMGGGTELQKRLADRGCYIEYDRWGEPRSFRGRVEDGHDEPLPTIHDQLKAMHEMIDAGYIEKLLFAEDLCYKMDLHKYGGRGYDYLLKYVVPRLRQRGLTENEINTIFIENPKRVLTPNK